MKTFSKYCIFPLFLFAVLCVLICLPLFTSHTVAFADTATDLDSSYPKPGDVYFNESGSSITFADFALRASSVVLPTSGSSSPAFTSGGYVKPSFVFSFPTTLRPSSFALSFSNSASPYPLTGQTNYGEQYGTVMSGYNYIGYTPLSDFSFDLSAGTSTKFSWSSSLINNSFVTASSTVLKFGQSYFLSTASLVPALNSVRSYFRSVIYVSAPVLSSTFGYFTCEEVLAGQLTPDGYDLYNSYAPGSVIVRPRSEVPSDTNSWFLSRLVFYTTNNVPVLYIYYPCLYVHTSSRAVINSDIGMVRYSSYFANNNETYTQAYNQGYSTGFDNGKIEGTNSGYKDGQSAGYQSGYATGYQNGVDSSNNYSFFSLISAVLSAPIGAITSLLSFEVLGVEMSTFFFSLLTVAIIIKIVGLIV